MDHTADADHQGVMIALVPSKGASQALLDHSGGTEPLEDQHITLAYLGTVGEEVPADPVTRDLIENVVGSVATRYAALNGEANGWGVFHNEEDVVVALWNVPGINGLRQTLVDELRQVGVAVKSNYSYTPHQTMGYYQAADHVAPPSRLDHPVKSDFRYLSLHYAGEVINFALTGVRHEAKGPARGGNPDNPGQFSSQDKGYRKKDKTKSDDKGRASDGGSADKASDGGSEGGGSGDAKTQQAPEQKSQEQATQPAQEPQTGQDTQESTQPAGQTQDAQETPQANIPPGDNYTGSNYAAIAESSEVLTDEQKKMVGDLYLAPLPAGKYPEGDPRNEPEAERVMAEKEALVEQHIQGPLPGMHDPDVDDPWTDPANAEAIRQWRESGTGGQSRDLHDRLFDPKTGKAEAYTPERTREHHRILREFQQRYIDYPREGKAVVMAGPPGAGKSTFLEKFGQDQFGIEVASKEERDAGANPAKNYVTINPDDFKDFVTVDPARYPGLNENELAAIKHEESSFLAKAATRIFMSQGYNVIIDITLGSSASAMKKYYTPFADNYDYSVALVDGDMKNSRNNAGIRWKRPDKKTGKRTYSGRFIPMSVIENNAPDKPGFRSKNASEFMEFIKNDKVSKSVVYDPYNADAGVQPAAAAYRPDESAPVSATASHRGNMKVKGPGGPRKEFRLMSARKPLRWAVGATSHDTTEVTELITQFAQGQMTEDQLVETLVNYDYAPNSSCPHRPNTPEWYQWHEDDPGYDPGTYDEVILARDIGLLPWETFHKINDKLTEGLR